MTISAYKRSRRELKAPERKRSLVEIFCEQPAWYRGLVIGTLSLSVGLVMGYLFHVIDVVWYFAYISKNVLDATIIGYATFWLGRERDLRMSRRMEQIDNLNHHIRNALQAIELSAFKYKDECEGLFEVVQSGAKRITFTLDEVTRSTMRHKLPWNRR